MIPMSRNRSTPSFTTWVSITKPHQSLSIAQQKLRERHFSAIVLDLMIEQENGIGFLRALKSGVEMTLPPTVIACGNIDEDKKTLNGDAIGIVDWLTKPIDEARLVHGLKKAIAGRDRPRIPRVEDDIALMQVIERSLQGGVELVMAPTLRDARETLKASEFQLIVLDLGMPGGSGLEFLGQLGTLTSRPTPTE
jgi:DNA-binding response OmpR family regulator